MRRSIFTLACLRLLVARLGFAIGILSGSIAPAAEPVNAAEPVAAAEPVDTIWLEPATVQRDQRPFLPRSLVRRHGTIESFDDQSLVFSPAGEDGSLQVASSRVIWAEPGFSDQETIAAVARFRAGQFKESISPLLEAITRRPSVWRAQWLSMHLWQAAYRAQRYPAVLELVEQIDARPSPALLIGGLPIHWADGRLPPAAVEAAHNALAKPSSSPAARLVAASWLLGQSADASAVVVIEAIAEQRERPLLAAIAETLLWRKATPPSLREQRDQWKSRLAELPLTLYPGPAALLAHRLEAIGDREQALELFLSVAVTPPRPHEMSSYANTQAVSLLEQLGRPEEAVLLKAASR